MIYEFITPSDPITFKADDNKIAFTCALLLGGGKAGCDNIDTGESIPTMLMFSSNPEEKIVEYLGVSVSKFIEENKNAIKECFDSFSYGSVSERHTYDDAIAAITDPIKLQKFKSKHEDKNRTSMSAWVARAWDYAKKMK